MMVKAVINCITEIRYITSNSIKINKRNVNQ